MAQYLALFIFTLALSNYVHIGSCHVLQGSVTCMDCDGHHYDLSGIKVSVKCAKMKKLATTITEEDGSFEINLPMDTTTTTTTTTSNNICHANIVGGPSQLFVSRKDNMDTKVVKIQDSDYTYYTISKPLKFYTKCPTSSSQKDGKKLCSKKSSKFGSSKTVDFPFPGGFGLAPSSYYLPVLPIIGIP